MRWVLLSLALLFAVAGLLYRGGVAFVSTLSETTASLRVDGTATAAAPTGSVEAPTWPPRADEIAASGTSRPESSPGFQPAVSSNPEAMTPDASDQRVFKSRRALETVNPRELVR